MKWFLLFLGIIVGRLLIDAILSKPPVYPPQVSTCPTGFYNIGGGYCRNIICAENWESQNEDAAFALVNEGGSCYKGYPAWGESIIPLR